MRSLMNYYPNVNNNWFELKYNKPWWWKLLHPKQARVVRIWLEHCEKLLAEELKFKTNQIWEEIIKGKL